MTIAARCSVQSTHNFLLDLRRRMSFLARMPLRLHSERQGKNETGLPHTNLGRQNVQEGGTGCPHQANLALLLPGVGKTGQGVWLPLFIAQNSQSQAGVKPSYQNSVPERNKPFRDACFVYQFVSGRCSASNSALWSCLSAYLRFFQPSAAAAPASSITAATAATPPASPVFGAPFWVCTLASPFTCAFSARIAALSSAVASSIFC